MKCQSKNETIEFSIPWNPKLKKIAKNFLQTLVSNSAFKKCIHFSLPKIRLSSDKMESWPEEETQKGPQQISSKVAMRLFKL